MSDEAKEKDMAKKDATPVPGPDAALYQLPPPSPDREAWLLIKEQAKAAIASGLLPRHITRPEQAAIIALKGKELGIPFMHAMNSISVINGKTALSAELMLALIFKRVRGVRVTFKTPPEKVNELCEIEFQRPGGDAQVFRFTLDDARRAGLLANPSWVKYPAALLRARCISAMARACAPDAIMGSYTPEELGGEPDQETPAQPVKIEAAIAPVSAGPPIDANSRFK